MQKFWLAIDCGGTYLKAGLYDDTGQEYHIERHALQTLSTSPGYAERDMNDLWCSCVQTIKALLKNTRIRSTQIQGIGISAQGKGLFLLDKQDQPLGNAILSSDRRALTIVKRWQEEKIPEKIYPITRQTVWTGHPASILRWLKKNDRRRYDDIGCVMMAHDYLRWRLTEQKGCEKSNISESNLYNIVAEHYDPQLMKLLGVAEIEHALPPVVGSTEICGTITNAVAKLTGLAEGTPVVGGVFDVVSTAICAGLRDEHTINAVMGTWAVTTGLANQIKDHEAHPYVYGCYVQDGQYIVHEASPTSSANLEWVTAQFGKMGFDEINQAIEALPKVSSDVIFLPFLYGSNAGLDMTGGFYGLQSIHTKAHMLQAVYEGVVFSHMTHITRILERFTGVKKLRVTGGPAHSKIWMQILADVSGLTLEMPKVEETACLGAALVAQVGTGIWATIQEAQAQLTYPINVLEPDRSAYTAYQKKYRHYQYLIEALQFYHTRINQEKR
ncbi:FGGY-family carbohydrate kinase [Commensalibacter oyaizuii]|uniref:FGGY-family carbohydrate kinase n=1 Tax=Commensalibacter oyaizuii TaxID=3043873 RepID=A0ABT6Q3U2_9PROT|nr:FGGY-family carbohydrate kinase [Commensalibacter sp. TBRC 16381]MDI2091241.1 FGGY-family carbohydrate kinase [Commensalibacter sp. TBRC 16381]